MNFNKNSSIVFLYLNKSNLQSSEEMLNAHTASIPGDGSKLPPVESADITDQDVFACRSSADP